MEVNLGDMKNTSGEREQYWLVAIRAAREAAWLQRQRMAARQRSTAMNGHKIPSKFLCKQGWMAFSSQLYQGQWSLKENSPLLWFRLLCCLVIEPLAFEDSSMVKKV
jgi:hypothetical protein